LSNSNNIENKINGWLLDEQQTITKLPNEKTDFLFKIDKVLGSVYPVNVAKIKNRDLIQAVFAIIINPKVKKELLKKEKKKMSSLLRDLVTNLTTKGVQFAWVPNIEELKQLQIQENMFASEITKTQLFNGIRKVKDAGILALLIINNYVNIESSTEADSGSQPGVG